MSPLSRLAPRDLELLSAYIDGALTAAERQAVDRRLEEDPSLRQALKELRTMSALLRALPQVRPPHNFTLTPEMAGVRSGWLRTPLLQLATAVATLAFVVTVGVDVLGGAMPSGALRAAAPAQEWAAEAPTQVAESDMLGAGAVPPAAETGVTADRAVMEATAEVAAAGALEAGAAAPAEETASAEKTVVEETPMAAAAPMEAPPATPTAAVQAEESASREAPAVQGAAEAPPEPTQAETPVTMLQAAPATGGCETCGPDLVLPTAVSEEMTAATAAAEEEAVNQQAAGQVVEPPTEQPAPEARLRGGLPAVRWLEIGLGACALLLGSITLWARRRAR